jgi:hypothetical protein
MELNLVRIANMTCVSAEEGGEGGGGTCVSAEEDVHVLCNVGAHRAAFHLQERDKAD